MDNFQQGDVGVKAIIYEVNVRKAELLLEGGGSGRFKLGDCRVSIFLRSIFALNVMWNTSLCECVDDEPVRFIEVGASGGRAMSGWGVDATTCISICEEVLKCVGFYLSGRRTSVKELMINLVDGDTRSWYGCETPHPDISVITIFIDKHSNYDSFTSTLIHEISHTLEENIRSRQLHNSTLGTDPHTDTWYHTCASLITVLRGHQIKTLDSVFGSLMRMKVSKIGDSGRSFPYFLLCVCECVCVCVCVKYSESE